MRKSLIIRRKSILGYIVALGGGVVGSTCKIINHIYDLCRYFMSVLFIFIERDSDIETNRAMYYINAALCDGHQIQCHPMSSRGLAYRAACIAYDPFL